LKICFDDFKYLIWIEPQQYNRSAEVEKPTKTAVWKSLLIIYPGLRTLQVDSGPGELCKTFCFSSEETA
jgi:hypothetical protein